MRCGLTSNAICLRAPCELRDSAFAIETMRVVPAACMLLMSGMTLEVKSIRVAARRGPEIVRTYADEGKSGLRLDGRDALKRLIENVQSGKADFTTILDL
jgi:hypothetical protein